MNCIVINYRSSSCLELLFSINNCDFLGLIPANLSRYLLKMITIHDHDHDIAYHTFISTIYITLNNNCGVWAAELSVRMYNVICNTVFIAL